MGAIEGSCTPILGMDLDMAIAFTKVIIIASFPDTHCYIIDELAKLDLSGHTIIDISGAPLALDAIQKICAQTLLQTSTTLSECRWLNGKVHVRGVMNHTVGITFHLHPPSVRTLGQIAKMLSLSLTF